MKIPFTTSVFKEGRAYVAHSLELDVSSCGSSREKAVKNLQEAVRLFLEEAEKLGTLNQILSEAGYSRTKRKIESPKFFGVQRTTVSLAPTSGERSGRL